MASLDNKQKREKVQELLEQLDSPEKVYNLFKETGYENYTKDPSYQRNISEFNFKEKASNKIKTIYTVLDYQEEITVLLIETESLSKTHIRYLTERLSRKFNYVLPIFTSDFRKYQFVLPTFDETTPGEIDIQLTTLEADSENVFYSDADALSRIWIEEEQRYPHIWNKWEKAFNIDKVTKQFFEDYQEQFFEIREKVLEQIDDVHDAHEFTLQFMNRMMFVYFVDKKGWLEGEQGQSYIQWLWDKYATQGGLQDDSEDRFYDEWLTELFHKAFNNKFRGNTELPEQVNRSFQHAPYLNGGLFRENSLTKLDIELEDELIGKIIEDFFERYNFTIKEDSPVDKEVAVDPQMIGYVYETLSNKAEKLEDLDKDARKDFGIFYTPKEEVYFMVRRSLVEYLDNNTSLGKEKIYKVVFAVTDDEKEDARAVLNDEDFEEIILTLHNLKAVDPACGSGAFLVGIIDVLTKIYEQAEEEGLTGSKSMFERKKQIIRESIYGVDVKDWAINASELRMFLQLLIETDVPKEEIQRKALLPNLRANLRVGDSLVQDIDGEFLDARESQLEPLTRTRMEEIQKQKAAFFRDRSESEYDGIADIQIAEFKLTKEIIDDKITGLEEKLEEDKTKQQTLDGETKDTGLSEKDKEEIKEKIDELEELKDEVDGNPDKVPLIWEVAFAEVFKEKDGFDMVIGNPPYVRNEAIKPPNSDPEEVTKEMKKEYKSRLQDSIEERVPQIMKVSGKSDLYIYFYLHGLSLVNDDGAFCFITSNSWMDVEYGKDIQRYLCKYVPIHGIYMNMAKRSFEHADVNTVISIFGAPNYEKSFRDNKKSKWPETDRDAKFIRFEEDYRQVLDPDTAISLDSSTNAESDEDFQLRQVSREGITFTQATGENSRMIEINQEDLLEDGWKYYRDTDTRFSNGRYRGNKWSANFLRSPDLYFDLIKEKKDKLVRFKDAVDYSYGLKTGKVDFFYVSDEEKEEFDISEEYLHPIINSSQALDGLEIRKEDTEWLFCTDKSKDEIEDQGALDYIEWGEENDLNTGSSVESHNPYWYSLDYDNIDIILYRFWDRKFMTPLAVDEMTCSDNFYYGVMEEDYKEIRPLLNSTFYFLQIEIFGRINQGEGVLNTYGFEYEFPYLIKPEAIDTEKLKEAHEKLADRDVKSIFDELKLDRFRPIRDQEPEPLPDRKELDDIVFDALGLSEDERKEVYWSVAELVKARLDKAESV